MGPHPGALPGPPLRRPVPTAALRVKHAADRLAALAGLLLLGPLLLAIAAAVRLGSPGPALYRQVRLGQDGRPFTLWKFRTMVRDADLLAAGLAEENEHDGPMFKMRRDPRVTRVGRFLRRFSLDELPQLLNVLAGRMSLVGPRPPLPEEAVAYTARERGRLAARPGLTGLWQVSGRADLSWEQTVALDLHYIATWSLGADLRILARTLRAVLDGRGAY